MAMTMKKLFLLFAALPLILCAAVEMPEFKLKDFGDNGSFKLEAFDGKDVIRHPAPEPPPSAA